MRIGVQQKFNQTLNGVVVDLNSFDATFLGRPASGQPVTKGCLHLLSGGVDGFLRWLRFADPDGSIASYSWDFGDGSPTGTGVRPKRTYSSGGTYQVKLTVTDNAGATGSVANPVTIIGPAATVPAAPTGATAVAGNASATVNWTAPNNGGSAITSYTVTPYVGSVASQAPVQVTATRRLRAPQSTGLANGTAYAFTVSASNAVGTSAPSADTTPVTPSAPPGSLVQNGGFESGGLASWTAGGIAPPKPAATADTGSGSALLGASSGSEPLGDSTLSQSIAVPLTGTSTLSFWYRPHTADTICERQEQEKLQAGLDGGAGTQLGRLTLRTFSN